MSDEQRTPLLRKPDLSDNLDRISALPDVIIAMIDSYLSDKDSRALRSTSRRLSGREGKMALTSFFLHAKNYLRKADRTLVKRAENCCEVGEKYLICCFCGLICCVLRMPSNLIVCFAGLAVDGLSYTKSSCIVADKRKPPAYVNYHPPRQEIMTDEEISEDSRADPSSFLEREDPDAFPPGWGW